MAHKHAIRRSGLPGRGWLLMLVLLAACSSQPAKYRRKKECDCPKWNRAVPPPGNSERACSDAVKGPYYCGPASHS